MRARILLAAALAGLLAAAAPARAQLFEAPLQGDPDARMLLEADELLYDTETGRITAIGNVAISYRGYQVFASEVSYDDGANRLTARGGARLEEPGGNIVIADTIDLSDDLRDGFLTGVRADTIYRTRLAANEATRSGNVTIFEQAGYTACYTCRRRPDQPPTWLIKARRIIYDEDQDTLRFEQPTFDVFGTTVIGLPSFTIPDPSVRRRSGFLVPTVVYSNLLGAGVRVPYFQTLGDSADLTVAVTPLSRQGLFGDAEFRQRTATGAWSLRASGIYQANPDAFEDTSGDQRLRGAIQTRGEFRINPDWRWGWESTVSSDRVYLDDYKQRGGENFTAPSTLYLQGLGERNFFDARLWGFRILQDDYDAEGVIEPPAPFTPIGSRLQGKQAFVHPVIDYEGVVDRAVLSGELSYRFNLTSLSRQETDAFGAIVDGVNTARFRGVEGTYTRGSAEAAWRKRIYAPGGQVVTPFAGVRGDVFAFDNRDPDVTGVDDELGARVMPWIGVNYSYPWLVTASWGTQTLEPIAEIIARPDETGIGDIPNEDSQSIVFDDTNLFGTQRFSGYDRVEGGVRANVGVRYTLQTYSGGFVSATVGQSFHLAGRNSYAVPDLLDSGSASGLSTDESDYVGSIYMDTGGGFSLTAKGRFDDEDFDLERAEVGASARTGPLSTRVVYAFLAEQPDLGQVEDQQEVQTTASLRVFDRVRLFGLLRYDLEDRDIIREGVGVAYDDDSFSASLAYSEDRSGAPDEPTDRTVFFRFGLRTIGDITTSAGLDN